MKNNNDPSEFTEETALAFFARHLDGLKWNYHRSADRPILFSGFAGDEVLWDFSMVARQKSDGEFLLAVSSSIPNKARPERRSAVAELLTRINWELSLGCFEMNHADGEIRFRTSVILPGADITEAIAGHLVRSNLCIVDERMPQITAVLYSNITPGDALKPKAEKPAAATESRFDFN